MPVYMNSGKIVADGTGGRVDGKSKVLQEVLADLKIRQNNVSMPPVSQPILSQNFQL